MQAILCRLHTCAHTTHKQQPCSAKPQTLLRSRHRDSGLMGSQAVSHMNRATTNRCKGQADRTKKSKAMVPSIASQVSSALACSSRCSSSAAEQLHARAYARQDSSSTDKAGTDGSCWIWRRGGKDEMADREGHFQHGSVRQHGSVGMSPLSLAAGKEQAPAGKKQRLMPDWRERDHRGP